MDYIHSAKDFITNINHKSKNHELFETKVNFSIMQKLKIRIPTIVLSQEFKNNQTHVINKTVNQEINKARIFYSTPTVSF